MNKKSNLFVQLKLNFTTHQWEKKVNLIISYSAFTPSERIKFEAGKKRNQKAMHGNFAVYERFSLFVALWDVIIPGM
jgi:hypothetical protein